jgi:hypothetical protein
VPGPKPSIHSTNPSELIDSRVGDYPDWRGETLAAARAIILGADSSIVEEWKWNVPVWSSNGIVCTGEVYKAAVKLTFAQGASLDDPKSIFTSSLDGKVRRAVDYREGEKINAPALKAMVKSAVKFNAESVAKKSTKK